MKHRHFQWLAVALAASLAWADVAWAGARELFEAGDFAPAAVAAQQALAAAPDDLGTALVLGQSQLMLDRVAEAVQTLREAAGRHPDSAEAHYRLGQALSLHVARSGTWRRLFLADDIGEAFERAVELAPRNTEYRWALFEFCRRAPAMIGGGRRKANAHAKVLAELDVGRGHRARAALLLQDGDASQGEEELRAAIAAQPEEPDHRYALGYFFQEAERWDEAFAAFEDIPRRFPQEVEAYFQVGRTAVLSGQRLDEGVRALQRYLQHKPRAGQPPLAWAHYRLGQLHELRRDQAAAAAAYEAALALNPGMPDARQALEALRRPA